jgi:TRAP-type C4-dicarboxylate transport system permease large subunit
VGPALLAGVVPGIVLCLAYGLTIVGWGVLRPDDAPRADLSGVSWRDRLVALRGAIPIAVVALVILGGMLSGLFTANEAAGVGALAAVVMSWALQGRGNRGPRPTWRLVRSTVVESITSLAGLFVLVIGSYLLSRLLTLSGLAQRFSLWLTELGLGRVALLLVLVVVYIVLGMFLESLPMILLTVPLLQAPLEAVGVDMLWFGVFMVIMCEIGMVFPPIGLLTFIVHRMVQDPALSLGRRIPLSDVFRGILPFVAAAILVTVVLILWPDIALWLPAASAGG